MAEQIHLVSASAVYKGKEGEISWFLVNENENTGWEIPKTAAKTGESSVRASVRSMGEQGGMRIKVLEEIGRHGGAAKVGGKILTQRVIYYLIAHKGGDEVLGFTNAEWVDHKTALRRVSSKLDREMLKSGRALLTDIRLKRRKKKEAEAKEQAAKELASQ